MNKSLLSYYLGMHYYGNTGCGVFKVKDFLPMNQHTQRNLLNFENWVNGEVSKIEHHFSK